MRFLWWVRGESKAGDVSAAVRAIRLPHIVLAGLVALAVTIAVAELWMYRTPARSDGRVEITYWEKWSGFEFDAIRSAVDAYNDGQGGKDGVYVHLVNVSQVDRKTMLAIAGGNPPDLAGNWAIHVAPFAEKKALTCLDGFIARDKFPLEDYVPPYLETCRYAKKLWALPIVPATTALFYNRKMFREAGLTRPPRTIQELDEFARKIDKFDEDGKLLRMGFLHTEPGWWKWSWGYYFGGRITDGNGKVLPDPAPWVKSLEWAGRYAEHYGRDKLGNIKSGFGDFDSPQNAFIAGKVGMVIQGVWMPNFINRYNRGLEYGVAPFPSEKPLPEGHPVTQVETDVITMPAGCPHPEEAWKFMKWLAGPEGAGILCLGQGKHTCLRDLPEDFKKKNPNPHIGFFHKLAFSRNAYVCGRFPIYSEFRREMGNAFDRVWQSEEVAPKDAIRNAQKRIQEALDRNFRRTERRPPAQ